MLDSPVRRPSSRRDDAGRVFAKFGHGLVHLAGEDVAKAGKGGLLAAHGLILAADELDELARVDVRVSALLDVLHQLRWDMRQRLLWRRSRRRRVHRLQRGLQGAQFRGQHLTRGPSGACSACCRRRGRLGREGGVGGVIIAGAARAVVGVVGRGLYEDLVEGLDGLFELD